MNLSDIRTKARELTASMTLEEKSAIVSGKNFWEVKEFERLGLKSMMLTDGPHGLRKQAGAADHLGINASVPATCFPTAATTACSFDTDLLRQMGAALGRKCNREDVAVILGPGVNIKRSPLCGRNFEYFSEDPVLAGDLAAALIDGVQSEGVGTSIKHFAANSQEHERMAGDSVLDERAFREIYLTAFERAITKAHPWTVMCSYNKINGTYASRNTHLLTDILRNEWGYEGMVVSDWGATDSAVEAIRSGMDLEMPCSGPVNARRIQKAVESGALTVEELDACVQHVTELYLRHDTHNAPAGSDEDDHELACRIASESMVLLKNNGVLPLKAESKIAFIGGMAKTPRYQGAGSSKINPVKLDNAFDCAVSQGFNVKYAQGYPIACGEDSEQLLAEAAELAKQCEIAVVFAGLPDEYESEGFDRTDMAMPQSHNRLIDAVTLANPHTIVVLQCGSPVELPWESKTEAILLSYLAGEAGGEATVDILFGKKCPCGKLAETWPLTLADTATADIYPGRGKVAEYRESIYVGYRYYDRTNASVKYPFGYGLSYTSFEYSNLKADCREVTLDVTNTGLIDGAEIVELYVSLPSSRIFRPVRELKGFTKVFLKAGETKNIKISLDEMCYRYYNPIEKTYCVEGGAYSLEVGASSRDIRLKADVMIEGDGREDEYAAFCESLDGYVNISHPLNISDTEFEKALGYKPPRAGAIPDCFTVSSTIGDIKDTFIGKTIIKNALKSTGSLLEDNADEGMKNNAMSMLYELPLRAMTMTGSMNLDQAEGIAELANGHVFRGIAKMLKKQKK